MRMGKSKFVDVKKLDTPCYIVDVNHLDMNIDDLKSSFKSAWKGNVIFGYSVKTNSLPWIITHMKCKGFFAEVVSEQEYRLAKKIGFLDEEIIFNGPVKSERMLIDALNAGAFVNLDNSREIDWLEKNLCKMKQVWNVGVRYNFLLENVCPDETIVGGECSRFGFCVENGEFGRAIKRIKSMDNINVVGLHGHNSTKSKSLNVFRYIVKKAAYLINRYELDIDYLDVGGGFYGDKPGAPSFEEYAIAMKESFIEDHEVTLIVEPGASLVSSPISYLSKVVNVKQVNEKNFITLDGSRIHIDPLMHGIEFTKKIYPAHNNTKKIVNEYQDLCGFTCIEMDRLGKLVNCECMQIDDRIEFLNCGSYSMTLAPLFISYFPVVYAYDNGEYIKVREAWDEGDFMQKCEVSM